MLFIHSVNDVVIFILISNQLPEIDTFAKSTRQPHRPRPQCHQLQKG